MPKNMLIALVASLVKVYTMGREIWRTQVSIKQDNGEQFVP